MRSTTRSEPRFLREVEAVLGFALHLGERFARRDKFVFRLAQAMRRKSEIADPVCGIEGATQQMAAGLDMPRPWEDVICEDVVGPGLEALQPAFSTRS